MNPYKTKVLYNVRIKMRDGIELSVNIFMPIPKTDGEKFPAILEMIPYRKDDWRYVTDHQRMLYFAKRGYVGCRLDIRGTGSSEGIALDEYTAEETQDGYETVEWLAAQDWCNGNVGMWGMSYGGFTSTQVAKLQPPHLKAIIAFYSSDEHYNEDSHYMGGCKTVSEWAQYAVSQVGSMPCLQRRNMSGRDGQLNGRKDSSSPPSGCLPGSIIKPTMRIGASHL
jgi:putative CocE/NonD family hydrolase